MLGIVMGAYSCQLLLPLALSLLNGVAGALANLKVLVPGSSAIGHATVLAGALNAPMLAALLGSLCVTHMLLPSFQGFVFTCDR